MILFLYINISIEEILQNNESINFAKFIRFF